MESKADLEVAAKALIAEKPSEAVALYHKLWDEYPSEFNNWDGFYAIKAIKNAGGESLDFGYEILDKFHSDNFITGTFGWALWARVKNCDKNSIVQLEKYVNAFIKWGTQKPPTDTSNVPCVYSLVIFKVIKVYADKQYNATQALEFLTKLNPDLLNLETRTFEAGGKKVEAASDMELYYAGLSKAQFKLSKWAECLETSQSALKKITHFHYNNDLWLKMRIALCLEELGHADESEEMLTELLATKEGSDKWFLYKDAAELFYENEEFNKAWDFTLKAAKHGNDPEYLIGLYLLQARILFKLERQEDARVLAELIAAILKEKNWNIKPEYVKLFDYFGIEMNEIKEIKHYLVEARKFWNAERYAGLTKIQGIVFSVHPNGKKGGIKTVEGVKYNFHKKDLNKKVKDLNEIKDAIVEFYPMPDYEGNPTAELISVISQEPKNKETDLVGKIVNGEIKSILDFGIFFKIKGYPDGLLHIKSLKEPYKSDFQSRFKTGEELKLRIIKTTDKGLSLELA